MKGPNAPLAAFVSGGSSGIGLAIARTLADEGYAVTLTARNPERLDAATRSLCEVGPAVLAVALDGADPVAAAEGISRHMERFGRLDVLVANAGIGRPTPFGEMKQRDVDRMIDLNVRAPVALLDAGAEALRTAGREHGRAFVFLTSSLSGIWPTPDFAVYSATKAVLVSLARSVNVDLAPDGVRACAVCPAFVDTPLASWVHERVTGDRMLRPEDVGEALRFLLHLSSNAVVSEIIMERAGARHGEP